MNSSYSLKIQKIQTPNSSQHPPIKKANKTKSHQMSNKSLILWKKWEHGKRGETNFYVNSADFLPLLWQQYSLKNDKYVKTNEKWMSLKLNEKFDICLV